MTFRQRSARLHSHDIHFWEYRPPASAEVVVFVHGIAGSRRTWEPALNELIRRGFDRHVIAIDLPGHGDSSSPRGDYSLGALASAIRDLLAWLGYQHATLVGHSLGGGVALQFAYQFPEWCDRVVLVDSGGLGREVTPVLRATAIPGAHLTLTLAINRLTLALGQQVAAVARKFGGRLTAEQRELVAHFCSLADRRRRAAFLTIARGVMDLRGQRATAVNRLYLADLVPTLIIWGGRDWLIPAAHGRQAAGHILGARLVIFEGAQHFPHASQPRRFADELCAFLSTTEPARLDFEQVAPILSQTR